MHTAYKKGSLWAGSSDRKIFVKSIDNVSRYTYTCIKLQREVIEIAEKSRANYFKERRKNTKAFYVEIEKDKMERFEVKISNEGLTKKDWLNEKIDEELKK